MMLRHYCCYCLFLPALIRLSYAFAPLAASYSSRRSPRSSILEAKNELSNTTPSPNSDEENSSLLLPRLIFPGGGLFFYWQAGVVSYMQEQGYNLSNAQLSGASAGALSATLTATGVDFYEATELALSLSEEAGVWDRPLGLQGIWGDMIHTWLDELLPPDADELVAEKLHVLVTPVPSFTKERISKFDNREDLIHCNLASVHIPWFLNGDWTRTLRGQAVVDGSFMAKPSDYFDNVENADKTLILDFKRDPLMRERSTEFVKVRKGKQFIWDILEQGRRHARKMDRDGEFNFMGEPSPTTSQ